MTNIKELAIKLDLDLRDVVAKFATLNIKKTIRSRVSDEEKDMLMKLLTAEAKPSKLTLSITPKKKVDGDNTTTLVTNQGSTIKVEIKRRRKLSLEEKLSALVVDTSVAPIIADEVIPDEVQEHIVVEPEGIQHEEKHHTIPAVADDGNDKKGKHAKTIKKTHKMKIIGIIDESDVDDENEVLPNIILDDVIDSRPKKDHAHHKTHRVQEFVRPVKPQVLTIEIAGDITVGELSHKIGVKVSDVIKKLMNMGMMVTINQLLDHDIALLLVEEFGHKGVINKVDIHEDYLHDISQASTTSLVARAPIVTVMGHVDHGKTSLLDCIRKTQIANSEAGGITQHIGAYHVDTGHGIVTFLDTPGHEAFAALRARGAQLTDIVILVVAADDGIMPQTIEAIHHSQAAKVPIVVAINKIDKTDINLDRVKQELSQHNVTIEEWGGDVMTVNVSAKTGEGIKQLLDAVLLQADLMELKASLDIPAQCVVVESRLDKGIGIVVTVLVRNGIIRKGDFVLSGTIYGKVRAMIDEHGKHIHQAGPSIPVELLGLSAMPEAGSELVVVPDQNKAKEIASHRLQKLQRDKLSMSRSTALDGLFANKAKFIQLIIKADAQGSFEAINNALQKLNTDEVKVNIIHSAVGGINESDINLAIASNAIVIGFNARADANARKLASANAVEILYYNVIYNVIDDIKLALSGLLSPEKREAIIGNLEVRRIFTADKTVIAGCMVLDGLIKRGKIRIVRDGKVIYDGTLSSLKRFKDDVKEVKSGYECGISIDGYNDLQVNDIVEYYEIKEVARSI